MSDNEIFSDMPEVLGDVSSDENLQARVEAALGMGSAPARPSQPAQSYRFDSIGPMGDLSKPNIDMLMDVNLQLTVELGRTRMTVRQVLDLQSGSVVELDRIAGEAVDIFVNDRMLARGEVVVVDDKFGVRITELVQPPPHEGEM
jgi:flagellar motor switch protein FliN/FliY